MFHFIKILRTQQLRLTLFSVITLFLSLLTGKINSTNRFPAVFCDSNYVGSLTEIIGKERVVVHKKTSNLVTVKDCKSMLESDFIIHDSLQYDEVVNTLISRYNLSQEKVCCSVIKLSLSKRYDYTLTKEEKQKHNLIYDRDNTIIIAFYITRQLCNLAPQHAAYYHSNFSDWIDKLNHRKAIDENRVSEILLASGEEAKNIRILSLTSIYTPDYLESLGFDCLWSNNLKQDLGLKGECNCIHHTHITIEQIKRYSNVIEKYKPHFIIIDQQQQKLIENIVHNLNLNTTVIGIHYDYNVATDDFITWQYEPVDIILQKLTPQHK